MKKRKEIIWFYCEETKEKKGKEKKQQNRHKKKNRITENSDSVSFIYSLFERDRKEEEFIFQKIIFRKKDKTK